MKNANPNNNPYPYGYTLPYLKRKKNYSRMQNVSSLPQALRDYGPYPFALNISDVTKQNDTFRTALWTGNHLQLTVMSIPPGEDIGLERHDNLDQFIRVESGRGMVMMGDTSDTPNFQQTVSDDYAFIIPAGKWHNVINLDNRPLNLYSIYTPVQHPFGTVHPTKQDAIDAEAEHHN